MQIGKRRLSVRGAAWRRPTATPNEEMKEEEKERFTPSPPTEERKSGKRTDGQEDLGAIHKGRPQREGGRGVAQKQTYTHYRI